MESDLTNARLLLERTPSTLQSLLRGLPDVWARANEGAGTWRHIVQVSRTLARQLRDDVGPWTAYLGVLGSA